MMKGMLKRGFQSVKNFMSKSKKVVAAAVVGGSAIGYLAISTPAKAADMTSVTGDINTEFGTIVTAALTVLGSVAVAALVLFGGIYAWKYGKKVFSVIAK